MSLIQSVSQGWDVFKDTLKILRRYPILAAPLVLAWVLMATVTLLLRYLDLGFFMIFLMVFVVAYSLSLACLQLLELIQQIESGEPVSFWKASREMISKNALKAIPIAFVWAIIWFILLILRALTRRKDEDEHEAQPSLEDAGRTLSGMNGGPFSWLGLGLDMVEKLIRMIVFAVLPAIAWEDKGPWQAWKKGSSVVRKHPGQFLTSYGLTTAAGVLMALPLIPVYMADKADVELSAGVWVAVIIYSGIIWTIEVYLEQMSVALLYLWHLKSEHYGIADLESTPRPDLLDNIPELGQRTPPPTAA